MQKENVRVYVLTEKVTYETLPIDQFIEKIADAKSKGATTVDFDSEVNWDSPTYIVTCYFDRIETDEEQAERLERINTQKAERRERDLQQLERIKKRLEA